MSAKGKVSIALLLLVAFAAGIFFTTIGANLFDLADAIGTDSRASDTRLDTEFGAAMDLQEAFIQVAESVNPTVVQIRSERLVEGRRMPSPFQNSPFDQFFPDFFGDRQIPPQLREGLGSGVIVRSNGYIVTNNHVIEGADELTVVLYDGREYDAEVVGADPRSDLAVVKIDETGLTSISYGNAENARTGQWVLAFGSPLSADLENTVTAGIVSAMSRVSTGTSRLNLYAEFIQTDAAINPGNSGGPLVNLRGEMIGINTAILSRTRQYAGIGFAIPVNLVESVAGQLIETGTVARAYLGVRFAEVPETLADALDIPRGAAQITQVAPETPADRAGLQAGDIIVAIDGQQLTNYNELRTTIGTLPPGAEVELIVVNTEGERRTVGVTLGEQPEDMFATNDPASEGDGPQGGSESLGALGLSLRDVTPQLLRQLGLENEDAYEGVLITDVNRTSAAFRDAQLRRGDIVVEIGRERVRSEAELLDVYRDIDAGEDFLVRVLRVQGDEPVSFVTALEKPAS